VQRYFAIGVQLCSPFLLQRRSCVALFCYTGAVAQPFFAYRGAVVQRYFAIGVQLCSPFCYRGAVVQPFFAVGVRLCSVILL